MLKLIHIWGAYFFVFAFLVTAGLGVLSLVKQDPKLERFTAWAFVACFVFLAIPYFVGFTLKADLISVMQEPGIRLIEKHHSLSKFVLTGCILIAAAAVTVLYKYRQQRFPNWFLPNLLFLSLMVVSFSARSLVSAWRLPH